MVVPELVLSIYKIYEMIKENQSPCLGLKIYPKSVCRRPAATQNLTETVSHVSNYSASSFLVCFKCLGEDRSGWDPRLPSDLGSSKHRGMGKQ